MTRRIDGLLWAKPCDRPSVIPVGRPRGAKAAGLRYERKLAASFGPTAIHGQWFEFEDRFGLGYCQPDITLPHLPRFITVIEAKYTLTDEAFDQLRYLYRPVISAVWNCPVATVAIFKNLPGWNPLLHPDLDTACTWSLETGQVGLIHWIGQPITIRRNNKARSILNWLANQRQTHPRSAIPAPTTYQSTPPRAASTGAAPAPKLPAGTDPTAR